MSFAIIAISVAGIGAGVGAYGAISSAKAQANAANYNAKVESNNAGASAQQAKFDASQIQDATRRNVAQQRAAMAASGFDANTGTFADVTTDTKRQGELTRLTRIYQGRLGSNVAKSQSQLYAAQAGNDITAGYFGADSSVLGVAKQATEIETNPAFG